MSDGLQGHDAGSSRRPSARLIALVVVLVVGMGAIGYVLLGNRSTPKTLGTQPAPLSGAVSTTSAPVGPAPPVGEDALHGLLLTSEQMGTVMGTSGMKVTVGYTQLADTNPYVSDNACQYVDSPATSAAYAGSHVSAIRGESFLDTAQFVVLFPSAGDAQAFYTASTQRWPACSNRQYTLAQIAGDGERTELPFAVGPVTNVDGILSTTRTNATNGFTWQRALTVANNVVIDTMAPNDHSNAAVDIAHQIAANVSAAAVVATQQQQTTGGEPAYGAQVTLPFAAQHPFGVAADGPGNVYVVDWGVNDRVLKMATGSSSQTALPFTRAVGAAVDGVGNIYVTDSRDNRVLKLAVGAAIPTVLPFTDLNSPRDLAVDSAGNVYVAELNDLVVRFAAGSHTPTALPFTGLGTPNGVAVDGAGDVFVADVFNDRVLELAAGSATSTVLPFTNLNGPDGIAVDAAGNLYVTDPGNERVLKLVAGSNTPTALPLTGLSTPNGVAVDGAGSVYVIDNGTDRVLKLPMRAGSR